MFLINMFEAVTYFIEQSLYSVWKLDYLSRNLK